MDNINTREYWDKKYEKAVKFSSTTMYILFNLIPYGLSVLDIGCGTGHLIGKLAGFKKCKVYGIDISNKAINILHTKGINGEVWNAENLDGFDKKFDVVVLSHILEHITDEENLIRNSKPIANKFILVAVPNNLMGSEEEPTHLRKYTKVGLSNLLSKYFNKVEDYSSDKFLIMKAYV